MRIKTLMVRICFSLLLSQLVFHCYEDPDTPELPVENENGEVVNNNKNSSDKLTDEEIKQFQEIDTATPESAQVPELFPVVPDDGEEDPASEEGDTTSGLTQAEIDQLPEEYKNQILIERDIEYQQIEGVDKTLRSLDVHYQDKTKQKPVVMLIHGGGWSTGDKKNFEQNQRLFNFFIGNGYIVVNLNFRLIAETATVGGVTYGDVASDIVGAISWITKNIDQYGGLKTDITLVGYDTGAHLAALITTDLSYLTAANVDPNVIKSVLAWGSGDYDIPSLIEKMPGTPFSEQKTFYQQVFGATKQEQLKGSPANFLPSSARIPFLIVSTGLLEKTPQSVTNQIAAGFKNRSFLMIIPPLCIMFPLYSPLAWQPQAAYRHQLPRLLLLTTV